MSILAQFDGYTLRATDALSDLEQLEKWIEADDTHRGIFKPWDFMSGILAADPRPTCYALEDSDGVIFYIRISRAARVRMQFAPETSHRQRSRVMQGLLHGMTFLEAGLSEAGVEEWIFDTDSAKLKTLVERLLGFTESTHELVRSISRPEATNVRRPD